MLVFCFESFNSMQYRYALFRDGRVLAYNNVDIVYMCITDSLNDKRCQVQWRH